MIDLHYSAQRHIRQRDPIPDHHREKNAANNPRATAGDCTDDPSRAECVADPRRHETPALFNRP